MTGNYQIIKPADHFELIRTTKPGFRAEVYLNRPHPVIRKIQWLDPGITAAEKSRSIREARDYIHLFVLMGE